MSLLRTEHLSKKFYNSHPLRDVTVNIEKGDIISIIGPSGTGKSTFMRMFNGLEKPTSGKVFVNDIDITDPNCDLNLIRRKVGMVFQSFNLFNHKTVLENITMAPIDLLKMSRPEAEEKAMELLSLVGLTHKANAYPKELSGGQKQRVEIARALAMNPEVILFDEPTSSLDPTMVNEVQYVISLLAKKGITMMIVTHEMRFAKEVANRVFYMDNGGICEDGPPEQIFENPQHELTKKFITQTKTIQYEFERDSFDFPGLLGQIATFGSRMFLTGEIEQKIEMITEEVLTGILLTDENKSKNFGFTLSHIQTEKASVLEFRYDGERFNPVVTENVISLSIVKHYAKSLEFSYDDDKRENLFICTISD